MGKRQNLHVAKQTGSRLISKGNQHRFQMDFSTVNWGSFWLRVFYSSTPVRHQCSLCLAVFKKYPLHYMQCARDLQEAEFLDLLRSTFLELAGNAPFDAFISDRTKKLQPLVVASFTPELVSQGAGLSSLYLRLKVAF